MPTNNQFNPAATVSSRVTSAKRDRKAIDDLTPPQPKVVCAFEFSATAGAPTVFLGSRPNFVYARTWPNSTPANNDLILSNGQVGASSRFRCFAFSGQFGWGFPPLSRNLRFP